MAGQTRIGSAIESTVNIIVGFLVSFAANLIVLPYFGFHCSPKAAFGIGMIYTIISFVRSFLLRRAFNWIMIRWHV